MLTCPNWKSFKFQAQETTTFFFRQDVRVAPVVICELRTMLLHEIKLQTQANRKQSLNVTAQDLTRSMADLLGRLNALERALGEY